MFLLKFTILFLLLQHFSRQAGIRGLTIRIISLKGRPLWSGILFIFALLVLSGTLAGHWPAAALTAFLLTLLGAALLPTQAYHIPPIKKKCSNGIEYFVLGELEHPSETRVFLHGAGNDALFDNHELFSLWADHGCRIISLNLPGHGDHGNSYLDPVTAPDTIYQAWREIYERESLHPNPIHLTGESLGAAYALYLALRREEIQKLDLLCPPLSIEPHPIAVILESVMLFGFQIWFRLKTNTVWETLPAFGWFKRKQFPIRTKNDITTGMRLYGECLKPLVPQLYREDVLVNRTLLVGLYHGSFDLVVPRGQVQKIQAWLEEHSYKSSLRILPGGHLSIKHFYTGCFPNTKYKLKK